MNHSIITSILFLLESIFLSSIDGCIAQDIKNLQIQINSNISYTKEIDPIKIAFEIRNNGDKKLILPSPCAETNDLVYIGFSSNLQIKRFDEIIWNDMLSNGVGKEVANDELVLHPGQNKKYEFYHVIPFAYVKNNYIILPPGNYLLRLKYNLALGNYHKSETIYSNEISINVTPYTGSDKAAYEYLKEKYIWPFVNEAAFRGFDYWESVKPDGKGILSVKTSSSEIIERFPDSNLAEWAKLNLAFYYLHSKNEKNSYELATTIAKDLLNSPNDIIRFRASEFIKKVEKK